MYVHTRVVVNIEIRGEGGDMGEQAARLQSERTAAQTFLLDCGVKDSTLGRIYTLKLLWATQAEERHRAKNGARQEPRAPPKIESVLPVKASV